MGIQTVINRVQGFGIQGELYDNSPVRAQPFNILSADEAYNVFGRAFSVLSEGVAQAGNPTGTAVFAGILSNPKASKLSGVFGNPLAPSLTLANNEAAELVNLGCVVVSLPASAAIGDLVVYDNVTGELSTITPGSALPIGTSSAYAVVDRFSTTGASLAVIRLTATPQIPV